MHPAQNHHFVGQRIFKKRKVRSPRRKSERQENEEHREPPASNASSGLCESRLQKHRTGCAAARQFVASFKIGGSVEKSFSIASKSAAACFEKAGARIFQRWANLY